MLLNQSSHFKLGLYFIPTLQMCIRDRVEGDHNIDCKIDGFGAMKLKSEFVKKI